MMMMILIMMMVCSPAESLTTISLDTGNIAYRQAASQSHTLLHYDPGTYKRHVTKKIRVDTLRFLDVTVNVKYHVVKCKVSFTFLQNLDVSVNE